MVLILDLCNELLSFSFWSRDLLEKQNQRLPVCGPRKAATALLLGNVTALLRPSFRFN